MWSCIAEEGEDDLEDAITSTTESMQYDHPNHTVTVTTISDLDLTGARLLKAAANQVNIKVCNHLNRLYVCVLLSLKITLKVIILH